MSFEMSELQPNIIVPRDEPDTLVSLLRAHLAVKRQNEKLLVARVAEDAEKLERDIAQRVVNIDYLLEHWPNGRSRTI